MRLRVYALPMYDHTLIVRLSDNTVVSVENHATFNILKDLNNEIVVYQIPNFDANLAGRVTITSPLLSKINQHLNTTLTYDEFSYIVVGQVVKIDKHPHSDHLKVCQVDVGPQILQIVCGASNVTLNAKVVVALEKAIIQDTIIKKGQLLKVDSYGMLCSAYELGLIKEAKKGLLILDESYQVGDEFVWKGE